MESKFYNLIRDNIEVCTDFLNKYQNMASESDVQSALFRSIVENIYKVDEKYHKELFKAFRMSLFIILKRNYKNDEKQDRIIQTVISNLGFEERLGYLKF